ncbi:hypothetical protein HK104_011002 [Borealophlyctis nickersoniae]|nr:hypothetical protein HK104_011002 [Borealophlyctis nickersoniae]
MTEVNNKDVANATAEASQHSGALPRLPTELLPLILRNISAPKKRTFYACCLLSKRWHDAASPFLWAELAFGKDYETREQLSPILAVQSKTVLVRNLVYSEDRNRVVANLFGYVPLDEAIPVDLLECVATGGFRGVRILDFEDGPSLAGADLSAVFVQCPHLIALRVNVVDLVPSLEPLDETGVLRDGFSRLKLLKLGMAGPGNCLLNLAAESVGTGLESVHFLTDPDLPPLTDQDPQYDRLPSLVGQRCPNLRDFSTDRYAPTPIIPTLPFWGKLLRLSCAQQISDESLRLIARLCVSLKYLELWWGASSNLRILADGPFLAELSLVNVRAISADDFASWLQRRGGSLTRFNAQPYEHFTEEMLEMLAEYAPNLEAVSVGQIDTAGGALSLLRDCAKLQTLCAAKSLGSSGIELHQEIVDAAALKGVVTTHYLLPFTRYEDLMKDKWIGL